MSVEMEWMDRNPPVRQRDKGEVHSVDCLGPNEGMEGDINVVVRGVPMRAWREISTLSSEAKSSTAPSIGASPSNHQV
jgi:hypothetical protein